MTLLTLLQTVADELGLTRPTAVASSTDVQVRQLLALINRVGEELMVEFPWQRLIQEHTFTTVGSHETYALPSDYDRPINQTYWDRTNNWELSGPTSPQGWQVLKSGIVSTGPRSRFRIKNNLIYVDPVPSAAYDFTFEYVSNGWVLDGDAVTYKARFDADDDTALFKDRLLILGTKLMFFEIKGLDTTTLIRDFMRALSNAQGQDAGAPVLSLARHTTSPFLDSNSIPESGYGS